MAAPQDLPAAGLLRRPHGRARGGDGREARGLGALLTKNSNGKVVIFRADKVKTW